MSRSCDLTDARGQFGHKVSHSARKTNRKFKLNLRRVALHSEAFGTKMHLRITTRTLRTINKYGSLDSFLMSYGYHKLSPQGRNLRNRVRRKLEQVSQK
jgi:large subunit ribosomal protein L28